MSRSPHGAPAERGRADPGFRSASSRRRLGAGDPRRLYVIDAGSVIGGVPAAEASQAFLAARMERQGNAGRGRIPKGGLSYPPFQCILGTAFSYASLSASAFAFKLPDQVLIASKAEGSPTA